MILYSLDFGGAMIGRTWFVSQDNTQRYIEYVCTKKVEPFLSFLNHFKEAKERFYKERAT